MKWKLLGYGILVLALAACNGASPAAPCAVTYSKQAGEQLLQRARQSLVPGRTVTLTGNNQEVSSLLSLTLEQARAQNPTDVFPLDDPIVCFANGKAALFGQMKLGGNAPIAALFTLSATVSGGKPLFKVEQIQLGPVAVPPDLSQQLTDLLNRFVSDYLGPLAFTEIRFSNGQALVTGQIRN